MRLNDLSKEHAFQLGSFALLLSACMAFLVSSLFPPLVNLLREHGGLVCDRAMSLKSIFFWSHMLFACLMFSTLFVSTVHHAVVIVALTGVSWAIAMWIPFTFIGEFVVSTTCSSTESDSDSHSEGEGSIRTIATSSIKHEDRVPSRKLSVEDRNLRVELDLPDSWFSAYSELLGGSANDVAMGKMLGILNVFTVIPQFLSAGISAVVFSLSSSPPFTSVNDEVGWVLR
jgi:solute carrier family 45 protein 1/2/4